MEYLDNKKNENRTNENTHLFDLINHLKKTGIKVGDKLPGIRALSDEMHLSQSQVRTALLRAEAFGAVKIQPRSGCYLQNFELSTLESVLRFLFLDYNGSLALPLLDIYEVKTFLERGICKRVAKIRTAEELLKLKDIIQRQEKAKDRITMINLDEEFHINLARLSRNNFTLALISVIQTLLHDAREGFSDYIESYPEVIADHWKMYESIRDRNEEMAARDAEVHANRRKEKLINNC